MEWALVLGLEWALVGGLVSDLELVTEWVQV